MKFSLDWLKDHLETNANLDTILDALNAIGLEVEGVENPADVLRTFTVAEVLTDKKHPDADKLKVCTVSNGTDNIQIVCGAPNARAGIKVVLGRPGDYVPGLDVTLKEAKIRGVASSGMICSARELEIGDEHDGIIELPQDAPVGVSYADYAGLDNPVIEIAITPNRQDCLGVRGIARDLAAFGLGTLKIQNVLSLEGTFESPIKVTTYVPDLCPYFRGRMIKGVKNGPSPKWLSDRLNAIGLRPISALVDITNYISVDLGRPLHVYDATKLKSDLQVRLAVVGEELNALDDKSYTANGGETVIADESAVLGFGGIIGGVDSGCEMETVDVVLEAALFDPVSVAMTGREHGIITDARYRFERGVDSQAVDQGHDIAAQMILDLCGGSASHAFHSGEKPVWDKTVSFRSERVKTLGGLDLPTEKSVEILTTLGFSVSGNDPYSVTVPSWRTDIVGEADIVEEVLRIYGLDNIPSVPLPSIDHKAGLTLSLIQKRARAAKRGLASIGMHEAVTWSFMTKAHATLFGGGGEDLTVENPISSDLDQMRPSILANLAVASQRNRDRGASTVALFEVGQIFLDDTEKGQLMVATGLRAGQKTNRHWLNQNHDVTVFDAKADALAVLDFVGAPSANIQVFEDAPSHFHPGRSGTLRLGPKNILATFGELHPRVLKALDVNGPVVGFEVFLSRVPAPRNASALKPALSMSNLQTTERDFAFLVDDNARIGDMLRAIKGADKQSIQSVTVFDVYQGKGVPRDKKSVAVSVLLEPIEATFSEKDIDAISAKVIAAAEKAVGASLRT